MRQIIIAKDEEQFYNLSTEHNPTNITFTPPLRLEIQSHPTFVVLKREKGEKKEQFYIIKFMLIYFFRG